MADHSPRARQQTIWCRGGRVNTKIRSAPEIARGLLDKGIRRRRMPSSRSPRARFWTIHVFHVQVYDFVTSTLALVGGAFTTLAIAQSWLGAARRYIFPEGFCTAIEVVPERKNVGPERGGPLLPVPRTPSILAVRGPKTPAPSRLEVQVSCVEVRMLAHSTVEHHDHHPGCGIRP